MRHTLFIWTIGLCGLGAGGLRAAGPPVVENSDHGLWDDAPRQTFQILEDLVLGSEDGDDAFGRIMDVAVDSHGRWVVLDQGFCEVKIYDPDELTMKTIGRKGEGPGEFSVPTALGLDAKDDIYVASQGGRVAVFAPDGELIDEFRHKLQGGGIITSLQTTKAGLYLAAFDPVGQTMIHRYDRHDDYVASFCKSWSAVKPMDERDAFALCSGTIGADAAGNILYTQSAPYEVRKFSPAGELLLTIRRRNDFLIPATIERTPQSMTVRGHGGSIAIFALPDGKIMNVVVTYHGTDVVYWATYVDLFDADGRFLKSRRLEGAVAFRCLDAKGRIYASLLKNYPQVARYDLQIP